MRRVFARPRFIGVDGMLLAHFPSGERGDRPPPGSDVVGDFIVLRSMDEWEGMPGPERARDTFGCSAGGQ